MLGGETFRRLEALATETTGNSVPTVIKAATSKIEALEQQLSDLRRGQGRTLSAKQRNVLRDAINAIRQDAPTFRFSICHNWLNEEAQQYARQFAQVLIPLNACGVPISTQEVADDLEGLVIRIKDHKASVPVPPNAMKLWTALSKAAIPCRFDNRYPTPPPFPLDDNYFDLAVGRKGDNEGNSSN